METSQTVPTKKSVQVFLESIPDAKRRADSWELLGLMQEITGEKPVLWGANIIGFGMVHYKYATGREGDMPIVSFSPRKYALTLYNVIFYKRNLALAEKLGPHTRGRGCLYIRDLHAVSSDVLKQMIHTAVREQNLINGM